MTALQRAVRKADLLRRASELVERLHETEAEHHELRAQRDAICRALRESGASIKELQEVLGMSRSRVQQILRATSS